MSRTQRCFTSLAAVALLATVASPSFAQLTFDFTSPDFTDGALNGQQGWAAGSGWNVTTTGGGFASTGDNVMNATYRTPVVLTTPGESFSYSVNMQWDGTYTSPTEWNAYLYMGGLKTSSGSGPITNLDPPDGVADINLQVMNGNAGSGGDPDFTDDYRLLNGFSGLTDAVNIEGTGGGGTHRLDPGDQLQIDYELTLGTDLTTTSYTARLQNLTDGTDTGVGSVVGVGTQFYDALTTTGVFPFVQRHTPNATGGAGLTTLQINEISGDFGAPLPPEPASPIFWADDAPPSGTQTSAGGVLLDTVADPQDPGNDVGRIALTESGTFVSVNSGGTVDVSDFEGQKFRAKVDYLIPSNTAFNDNDTFYIQVGFNDPITPVAGFGTGDNSDSFGFIDVEAEADDTWRTLEFFGTIPPDTNGGQMSITIVDDGFGGGMPDTLGDVMFIDNIVFEAVERLEGDFNGDGIVNLADYTVWRDNLGTAPPAAPYEYRDATNLDGEEVINHNGDGMNGVDIGDYMVWKNNFGATAQTVSLLTGSASVPEPSAIALCVCGIVAASWRRRAARRREVLA